MNAKPALLFLVLTFAVVRADEAGKVEANREAARLDLKHSDEGSVPGGATVVAGRWSVDAEKKLAAAPEPILDNWLEFGPEIREKAATILASGNCPGDGTLRSRIGVGLYGKNGVQLRFVAGRQELELVRRGEVLARAPFSAKEDDRIHLELSAVTERSHWTFSGRAWVEGNDRPAEALFAHKLFATELLFPMAGRAVLVATPFSGEAVAYHDATVYHGTYHPDAKAAPEKEEKPKEP